MRRQRDECYVLDTRHLGDADLIVTLLSEHHGKLRGVASSARRSRRRFGGRLEPLTRIRAVWLEREGRELHRLESVEGLRSYATMQSDPLRQATCAVLIEVSQAFAHEGQAEPAVFRLLGSVLDALEGGADPRTLLRYFEFWMLRLHGLLPDLAHCALCAKPLAAGHPVPVAAGRGARCEACPPSPGEHERRLTDEDRRLVERLRRLAPAELVGLRAARRSRALDLLLAETLQTYAEKKFRSYRHFSAAEADRPYGESNAPRNGVEEN